MSSAAFADPWSALGALGVELPEATIEDEALLALEKADQTDELITKKALGPSKAKFEINNEYDEEYLPFLELFKEALLTATRVRTRKKEREKAREWVFVRNTLGFGDVMFHELCELFEVRPLLLQAYIQHKWYQNRIRFDEGMNILADPLPKTLEAELLSRFGKLAVDISRHVWMNPSMEFQKLKALFDNPRTADVLVNLQLYGYMGIHLSEPGQPVYFISRNPDTMPAHRRRTFSWSSSIRGWR